MKLTEGIAALDLVLPAGAEEKLVDYRAIVGQVEPHLQSDGDP